MVEAVILAAGMSSRMGKNKLFLELEGRPVICHVLENVLASKVGRITVVVGHDKKQLMGRLEGYKLNIVENTNYQKGMSTSLQAVASIYAKEEDLAAFLFFNGDMPFIRPDTINLILNTYASTACPLIVPEYKGQRGHPVLIGREFFPQLQRLTGDIGARMLLGEYEQLVKRITVDDPGIHFDIDSLEDYKAAKRRAGNETSL